MSSQKENEKKESNNQKDVLNAKLKEEYEEYLKNLKEVYPGNKLTNDIYCKLISLVQNENIYLQDPETQQNRIKDLLSKYFSKEDDTPKLLKLYPDVLQFNQMKDLQFRNTPTETKEYLINFYMRKYFRLNNTREKILTKSNMILNFKDFNEKFQVNKDYKVGKINTEIEFTIKRLIRLLNTEEFRKKDFEYYLKHFKVKRIDSIFLKKEQNPKHHNLRKDDFDVFFREKTYKSKVTLHLKSFSPFISYCPIKSGFEIWKTSKVFLHNTFKKAYDAQIKNIKTIYSTEKLRCNPNDIKIFKEYFKSKYEFYYKMKAEFEDAKTSYNFTYDIFHPPFIISINSEIRPYLKELCEYFLIPFDLSIDKGKAFSYSIDVFYPKYFAQQSKSFQFNSYELTFNEIASGEIKQEKKKDIVVDTKTTEILRNKYNVHDGFLVNGDNKFLNDTLRHTSFKSEVYIKSALWTTCVCMFPDIDIQYQKEIRTLNEVGYVDSNFKYILEIIEKVDIGTLNRLIEDYTMNTSTRIRNTIKLISSKKEENEYSQLRELVGEIIQADEVEKGIKNKTTGNILNPHDEYTEKVDGDLLKYLMTLRFLKLRDYKFYVLNLLNYFRYIQKKIAIDTYKIENRNWKKVDDLNYWTDQLNGTLPNTSTKPKNLIINQPLSEFSKTNPIIPSLERIMESKKNEEEFNRSYFEEIDETVEYSDKLIRIKDAKGNYIIYEATLSDMKQLEEEFCKIGTYYIQKKEKLIVDTDKMPNPFIDRTQVILDLFLNEFDYLYAKFEYISEMMTIYENTTDIFKQKKIMKQITNLMAKRPILDLDYHYFTASYMVEVELLRKKAAFLHILVDYQKKMELNENRQLYDSIDKYYWLLGETALEIIQHVRLDKNDIEVIKQVIAMKKDEEGKMTETEKDSLKNLEEFINLFAKLKREKEMENELDLNLNVNEEEKSEKILKFDSEEEEEKNKTSSKPINDSAALSDDISEEKAKKEPPIEKRYDTLTQRVNILMRYLKKLFNIALTGGDDNFLDNDTESLIKSQDQVIESLKSSLSRSLSSQDSNSKKRKFNDEHSYSISNTSLDLLNYQIRSLLNIPNPFLETKYLNYIEKNPTVVSALNKEINFTKFEEGFPHKFLETDDSTMKSNEIQFFESLSEIMNIFKLINEAKENFFENFIFQNEIGRKGLEISMFDYLIEEWENFKDCITGKKSSSEFEKLYYLQNTIVDNYHSFNYTLKNLSATLCNPVDKIPPQLLASLPNQIVEKNDFETIDFVTLTIPKDPSKIENLMIDDLEKSLLEIMTNDFKSGWLKFKNYLDELTIYCNSVEMLKMKKLIFSLIVKNSLLGDIYEKQKQIFLNTNEGMLFMKESIGMEPFVDDDSKKENYVDRYYTMNNDKSSLGLENQIPFFSIEEFDPSLVTCVYFKDLLTVQINLTDRGLNELKTFAAYEYMNFFLLLIATQHNHLLFFDAEKYMSELNLFREEKIVLKNSLFNAKSVLNALDTNKTEKAILHEMTKKIEDIKSKLAKEFFYSIVDKKIKNRNNTLTRYNAFVEAKIKFLKKPTVIKHIASRHERLLLCNAYTKDIALEVFLDAIKLQACKSSSALRKIIKTIPKEYNVFEVNELNFIDNERNIAEINPSKNFYYFHDRGKLFNSFYIPSDIEILHLRNQNENDILYHYSKYNPLRFSEEVLNQKFYTQLKDLYFNAPTVCNEIENSRNKFFKEAFSYQSNALLYLQFSSFFLNFLNMKFIEICLTQKPMDIVNIIDKVHNGDDFWGDKKTTINPFDDNKRLPLNIVEKIVDTQKNYLNLRINFDKFKNDLDEIIKNLHRYLEEPEKVINYMNQYTKYKMLHWYHIFNIAREICLKKEDIPSYTYLTKVIKDNFSYGKPDYFKEVDCKFQCHLDNFSEKSIRELFRSHMHFEDNSIALDKLNKRMYYSDFVKCPLLNTERMMFLTNIKTYFPFIEENKIAEVRNLNFKISSMTKNYLIYIEKSDLNSDLMDLDGKRIEFLKYYIKLTEFKYKFIILLKNDFISSTPKGFRAAEKYINSNHSKIDCEWIENSSTSDPNEPDILITENQVKKVTKKTSVIFNQIASSENIFDNNRENSLKMKNTIIVEAFINGASTIFDAFCKEVSFILINRGINALNRENSAFKELFASTRNDLDINQFKNNFSSNFLKELDVTQISSINRKYPFFENFINRIKNISLEVETHSETNAILISKSELEEAIKIMIRDFTVLDTSIMRSNHFSYSSEKFGYYFSIKKLEIWLKAYKDKLTQFDNDLEKISNAKTALTNNTLVYEMDNLYRQLKVLKDNIKIMELYIRDYFEDKFNGLILSFKTEMAQIESKFHEFRNNLVIKTNQKITEEYNNCITELKNKTTFITETVNKISYVDPTEEKEFFDTFYRGLQMNQNHHKELNNERRIIEGLQDDIAKLHGYYRMKLHNQKVSFEKELDELRKNLSNNKDLWDKLAIAERNEAILKEELAKTQKSLAAAEEFIKRLRIQIRNSHDKNVALEKQISQITVKDIINNAGKGINMKAMELYSDIRQTYVYNMKNNVNVITALERIKAKYEKDEDIKTVLANFEMLHQKYAQEVDNKRNFTATLQNIRNDVERMQAINNKKIEDITRTNKQLMNENSNLKMELEKMKYNVGLSSKRLSKSNVGSASNKTSTDRFPDIIGKKSIQKEK